jgi:protein required for attachment to host cells
VEKVDIATEEQISELREKYIEALKAMYLKEIGKELLVAV